MARPNHYSDIINLANSFDQEDSIEIVVGQEKEQQSKGRTDNKIGNINNRDSLNGKSSVVESNRRLLDEFKSKINQRVKSKNQSSTIDVDSSLTPSLHTRSKGNVRMLNEFIPKNIAQQQKQFKPGRYEYSNNTAINNNHNNPTSNKPSYTSFPFPQRQKPLKQSTLPLIKSPYPVFTTPKPGESIHQKRKRPQQKQEQPFMFKGLEHDLIRNGRFNDMQKHKEEKRKEREERRKLQKENGERQKQQAIKRIQGTFANLLGLTNDDDNEKNKFNGSNSLKNSNESDNIDNDPQLKNIQLLQQIEHQEQYQLFNDEGANFHTQEQQLNINGTSNVASTHRYGLSEIIAPYSTSHAFPFVKAILGYKFTASLEASQNAKRIPNVFVDQDMYKKIFHLLVINECIADLHQRMKKIEKGDAQRLEIEIGNVAKCSNGLSEIRIRESTERNYEGQGKESNETIGKDNTSTKSQRKEPFLLKNYSMSRNRLGIITNLPTFSLQNYGLHSTSRQKNQLHFTFLCLLKTPESKQQLKDDVKCQAHIPESQLEFILKLTKSKKAYFYDLEKLSTSIREYMAISSIQYSFLAPHIYNPNFIETDKRDMVKASTRNCIDDVLTVLEKDFNKTQFQSIREMALRETGIVLLQGPPGTGKTSTLLGLLSAQYSYLKKIGDRRKIMICAPSNAAIDHITKRIRSEGLVDGEGKRIHPKVLRLGIVQTQDSDITSCSLDHICESKIVSQRNKTLNESKMTTVQIREHLTNLQKTIKHLNHQLSRCTADKRQKLQSQLNEKTTESMRLNNLLFSLRREKIVSRKLYQEMEKKLISQAQILIVTLSSSGGQKIEQVRGSIACLIVDQAAQATEPSLLIALQTGVDKVMLIGDPYQLPATTLSPDSNKTLFNRSLFQRFISCGISPYFLNIQYRMTPMIRSFPSGMFYQSRLTDGENIFTRETPGQLINFAKERSVIFIDMKQGREEVQESSFCNRREVQMVCKLLRRYKLLEGGVSVGVITPYQAQRKLLVKELGKESGAKGKKEEYGRRRQDNSDKKKQDGSKSQDQKGSNPPKDKLAQSSSPTPHNPIMINTIDSFQGQEKDLIIISTVRSNDKKQIGFLIDERRINVALTRAKFSLIIIGNGDTLSSNEVWNQLLSIAEQKKLYFEVNASEDEDLLLVRLNKEGCFNEGKVTRRQYRAEELTCDPRKQEVKEMKVEDFRRVIKKHKEQVEKSKGRDYADDEKISNKAKVNEQKRDKRTSQKTYPHNNPYNPPNSDDNPYQPIQEQCQSSSPSSSPFKCPSPINPQFPLKKGPALSDLQYQSQQLIAKKRKKQLQTKNFEQTQRRIKQLKKEKAHDDFYKFLYE